MKIDPEAKIIDIKILELPFQWKEIAPTREYGSAKNTEDINLIHEPTGTKYQIKIHETPQSAREVAKIRAKAKLKFIHELHGTSHIFNWDDY